MNYDWSFYFLKPYWTAFLRGTWVTIQISLISFAVGTFIGTLLGVVLRLIPFQRFFLFLNDAVRAVPIFVVILFVYYFPLAQITGIRPLSPFACTIIAMSISQAAYTAEVVRAAVDGVSTKVVTGGRAVGLRESVIWRYLILPDIFRQLLPTQIAFLIGIIRLSSIASVIGCEEVVFVARIAVSQNFRSLEAWVVVACIYVILVLPLTELGRYLERSQWLKRRY
jgi:His/Glu/Gln/Arg/opine family amino acid ABC transporter permease subunit